MPATPSIRFAPEKINCRPGCWAPLRRRQVPQKLTRKEIGLDEATFAKLDVNNDGELDVHELAMYHQRPADLEFTVDLGKNGSTTPQKSARFFATAVKESASGVFELSLGDAQNNLNRSAMQPTAGNGRANQYQFLQNLISPGRREEARVRRAQRPGRPAALSRAADISLRRLESRRQADGTRTQELPGAAG